MTEHASNAAHSFLYQAALTISAKLDTNEVLQQLMILTHQHFHPDAVSVALVRRDGSLVFRAASGQSAQHIIGMEMPQGAGIVGQVAEDGQPLWVADVYQDQRFYRGADEQTGFKTTAILAVPVKIGDQTAAVVEMINPHPDTDLHEAQETMTALASLAASAIQNARLFEQARRAEARYQSLFKQNLDPIIILDPQGQFLEVNCAAQKLLPLSPVTGSIADTAPTTDDLAQVDLTPAQYADLKAQVAAAGVVTWEIQIQTPTAEKRTLDVHLSYLPDYLPAGAYQWLAHDITDQVELNEMREQFSHMIVHDLRVPLNNITNTLELAMTAWRERDVTVPVEQLLEIGLRSAQRMERLISNILDARRLAVGQSTLAVSTIRIPDMVTEVVEIIQPNIKRRRHTFIQRLQDDLPLMQGDVDLLRRVLLNILDNAAKYTPDGGTIMLAVHADADNFHFAISDTGPGIPEEDQAHLFELFYRAHGHQQRGAGIGLAFCKLAVEAHGGHISVQSGKDKGAVFTFTIPRCLPANAIYSELTPMSDGAEGVP
ncbi:MAG TPA: ATP-binding protein [Anaerolineae bacterium]|nr:ATP-binding protein [Anaerolineae bacterium]HQH38009.1 ATP-binding protein [Anaerolineae bacterium]